MKAQHRRRGRRVLARYSAEDRERLIKEHAASGLTRREFCERHGINLTTFYGWFKASPKATAPQFMEVALPAGTPAAAIEIELGTAVRIRLHDGSQLQVVLAALKELGAC